MKAQQFVTELTREAELAIFRAVAGIRFGSVEISIQDSRIIQIERKEKVRLDAHAQTTSKSRRIS